MVSDHFDGRRFHNPGHVGEHGLWQVLRWALTRRKQPWPKWIDDPPQLVPPPRRSADEIAITFVNHDTFLLQLGGVNVLTDPQWSERAAWDVVQQSVVTKRHVDDTAPIQKWPLLE